MADEAEDGIENALNLVVLTTERSGNMKKELKQTIYETVSTLRNLFMQLRNKSDLKTSKISALEAEVDKLKTHSQMLTNQAGKLQGEPTVIPRSTRAQGATSFTSRQELARIGDGQVAPTRMGQTKLYSDVLRGKIKQSRHTLTVTSKERQPPDAIKDLLKTKINPTDIKVGISTLKTLRDGRVQIETGSKEEIETLQRDINAKCGDKVTVNVHKLRNPRLVIYNIPEDISTENIEDTLTAQNPELNLEAGDIIAKFTYNTKKRTRNLVIEVSARTRKLLIHKRVKLGWLICYIEDYLTVNRCFNCSKFNHKFRECRGTETCPHCTGNHKLKECTAQPTEFKCTNCQNYNKYNKNANICENHSSLDKNCPSFQAVLERHRQYTDY
jgi:hypothetical protein